MADILIRMNMPNSCVECSSTGLSVAVSILGSPCPWCREVIDPKVNLRIARHENCPLHELPEHGDLILREEALSMPFANGKYDHENADEHFIYGCETYKEWLEQLPVVISSNKEDTK